MANTQINVTTNGTTTLVTKGKYCDRNIDVNVAVPVEGITPTGTIDINTNGTHDVANYARANVNIEVAQPTQFTNYYEPGHVTIDHVSNCSSSSGFSMTSDTECNVLKIPYHHIANDPVVLRMRGIGTVRGRLTVTCMDADDATPKTWGQTSADSLFVKSYDECGDMTITFASGLKNNEWYYLYINFQYIGMSSATEALTGPIVTINEPIGNGGSV